ncbi:hypothetical protein KSP40_PGU020191 [Platanthera guangdongensis]|uniref:Uncharacterized protein n=1 Tax=Platanthera guangdongensis TaxID=2320717 RepID=A0ABR2N4Q8_9ASPA
MVKDTLERATEPNLDLKTYLQDAYIHPVMRQEKFDRRLTLEEDEESLLVPTKRTSRRSTPGVCEKTLLEEEEEESDFEIARVSVHFFSTKLFEDVSE